MSGEDRKQAAGDIVCECFKTQAAQPGSASHAHYPGYNGGDDKRHDRHAQKPEKNICQGICQGEDCLAKDLSCDDPEKKTEENILGKR